MLICLGWALGTLEAFLRLQLTVLTYPLYLSWVSLGSFKTCISCIFHHWFKECWFLPEIYAGMVRRAAFSTAYIHSKLLSYTEEANRKNITIFSEGYMYIILRLRATETRKWRIH